MTPDKQSVLDSDPGEMGKQEHLRRVRPGPEERRRILIRKRRLYTFLIWVCVFLLLVCAWAAFGMMMRIGFLPVFDLGYSWFDTHLFCFFGIATS